MKVSMEELVNYAKQYGFIFQGSEIYGGLANSWDYGPLGSNLKENIRNAWKKKFIQESDYNVALDAAIIMNPKVWEASGHVSSFSDPLIDCKSCKKRYRADSLVEDILNISVEGMNEKEISQVIKDKDLKCPNCGKLDWTDVRKFNLLFETQIGVTDDSKNIAYLRGETAQGIFVNFKNVERSMRLNIPFGIAQTGKAFRNEITPGNFIFRTREFEQMELQFFCEPGTDLEWFRYWKEFSMNFLLSLGLKKENLRFRDHTKEELSFYSVATTDIEYKYPMGFGELWGIADRTDYDLKTHMEHSKQDLTVYNEETKEKYIPYVIEPSLGLDRLFLAILTEAYSKEKVNDEERLVLKVHPTLAPIKATVLPLVKKYHCEKANEINRMLRKHFITTVDESGSIGKRYRRSDAIGTPLAITVDDETLKNNTVTIRNRDTMEQETISIDDLINYINDLLYF